MNKYNIKNEFQETIGTIAGLSKSEKDKDNIQIKVEGKHL